MEATNTELGQIIEQRLAEQNISIRDLAHEAEITYEHARRLVRGEGVPSRLVLKTICKRLGLDFEEMEALSVKARIEKKYGDTFLHLSGKNPELNAIDKAWVYLTDEQKRSATSMITGWAKANKQMSAN